ncbi:hypothetical protein NP493_10g02001 [Ridgeia piscesae]|uniref:Uncharacterized protein n=1 Tax=Ridgeia piscesae TaxID=27915 RepID=A0AAD9UL94_RIDPI|nr:hypothetical protein NP493_10g02001 [Ridgeia piscesae]
MNRPPPMAHSGGHMFLPSSLSSPPISRPLEDCSHNNASQSMPTGSPIMRSPQPLDISMASSPLVVPHPMKATRTPKSYHCRMCDQRPLAEGDNISLPCLFLLTSLCLLVLV